MTSREKLGLIFLLGAIASLGPFSIDMYLPGFPAIAEDLETEISKVALTLTSYFIGISAGQLVYGPLLDRYGRKRPLLIGLGIYGVAAIGCALAPDVHSLIGLRLVQALGGCVGMVASRAIVRDQFPVKEIPNVFSTLILVMGVAPIVAPTLGGYFMEHFGWQSIFYFLFGLSLLLVLLCARFLKAGKGPDTSVSLRLGSVARNYWAVFRNSDFLLFGLAGSLAMGGLFTYIAGAPFILMEIYGLSPKTFGWAFGVNAFGFIAGSQVNRLLLRRFHEQSLTWFFSLLLMLNASLLLIGSLFSLLSTLAFLSLLFVFLFLLGIINPNATALSLAPFEKNAGIASALIGSFRMLAGALGTGLVGFFHNGTALPMAYIMAGSAVVVVILLQLRIPGGRPKTIATV